MGHRVSHRPLQGDHRRRRRRCRQYCLFRPRPHPTRRFHFTALVQLISSIFFIIHVQAPVFRSRSIKPFAIPSEIPMRMRPLCQPRVRKGLEHIVEIEQVIVVGLVVFVIADSGDGEEGRSR